MNSLSSSDSGSYDYERVRQKPRTQSDLNRNADLKNIHKRNKISEIFRTISSWFNR